MDLTEALLTALLLGLGTARMAAIVSVDVITDSLRDLIFHWYPPEDSDKDGWFYQGMRPATDRERRAMKDWDVPWWQKRWSVIRPTDNMKPRKPTFLGQLIGCPKCTSVWIAAANVALLYAWRDAAIVWNVIMATAFLSAVFNIRYYK